MGKCKECGQEVKDPIPAIAERHGKYLHRHPELTIHQVIARIQTALDEGVSEHDMGWAEQLESERDGAVADRVDLTAERDRLKTEGRNTSARLQIVRKERDELLELRKHIATPIDMAEIDRLAGSVSMYSDSASRVQVTEVCVEALNTVAGRPLLAVTEDEIIEIINDETTYGEGDTTFRGSADRIMTLLHSRCRVVPGDGEIDTEISMHQKRFPETWAVPSEEVKAIIHRLLITPAGQDGGEAAVIENCMAFSNPDNIQIPCSVCGKVVVETNDENVEAFGAWTCNACEKAKGGEA